MSRIVIFGAGGTAGSRIVAEAAERGHEVVAVVRRDGSEFPSGVKVVRGDALDASSVRAVIEGAGVVVLAIGSMTASPWLDAAKNVAQAAAAEKSRPYLIHMGGGATLLAPNGRSFLESEHFPPEFLPPAKGQADALAWYRENADNLGARWTYLSPPPVDFAPGERTGHYRASLDTPVVAADGTSRASYEDFAVAVIDEAEAQQFAGKRFTIGY